MHDLLWWWCRRLWLYFFMTSLRLIGASNQPLLCVTGVCSKDRLGLSLCVVTAAPLSICALFVFVQLGIHILKVQLVHVYCVV